MIGNSGSLLYIYTNDKAPRAKVISIDLQRPEASQWKTIVPQQADTMETAILASGKLVCSFLHDAHSAARMYSPDGKLLQEIALPGLGYAAWTHFSQDDKELFFAYSEFTRPPSIFRLDIASGKTSLFRVAKLSFDPGQFETRQEFYHSKDGTRVPMFIISSKGMKRDGRNPTILYGYGGFNISLTPTFYPRIIAWLQMGGVYVIANLRGGAGVWRGVAPGGNEIAQAECL